MRISDRGQHRDTSRREAALFDVRVSRQNARPLTLLLLLCFSQLDLFLVVFLGSEDREEARRRGLEKGKRRGS